jgi:hypothetical protein
VRGFLIAHRDDHAKANAQLRRPELSRLNWAKDFPDLG